MERYRDDSNSHRMSGPRSLSSWILPFRLTATTTGGLVLATMLTSVSGFLFWWMAARQFPPHVVGFAGAALSVMIVLSQVSELGLGTKLAGLLHREERATSLALTALVASALAGASLGLAFALLAPVGFPELAPLRATPLALLLFACGVSVGAVASVLDQILVSTFRNFHRLLRNAVFSFGRLGLLFIAALIFPADAVVIYGVWVASMVASMVVFALVAHEDRLIIRSGSLMWLRLAAMTRGALSHHALNLSRSSSIWLLPLIVLIVLSGEANASFYVALLLSNFVALVGSSATFTLYVVAARAPQLLWHQLRFTLSLATAAAIVGTILLTVAGRQILGLFGQAYAASAYPTLVVLALSTLPLVVKDHWIAIQRVRGGVGTAAAIGFATLALELTAAGVGAKVAGLEGLAVARLVVLLAQAAAMAPAVTRALIPTERPMPTESVSPPASGRADVAS